MMAPYSTSLKIALTLNAAPPAEGEASGTPIKREIY
jgi:hypothetical protein